MHNYPQIHLSLSNNGVQVIEVLYLSGQRPEAWQFCQDLLPALRELDSCLLANEPGPNPS